MGRDAAVGPGFANFDLSLSKLTAVTERVGFQLAIPGSCKSRAS